MSKIVVAGSSNTDLVTCAPRIPSGGETVMGRDFIMAAGGKGANQAVAVKRLSGEVTFVACVGDDIFGQNSLDGYRQEGMDISHIALCPGTPSGVATITVDDNAENAIVVAPGANAKLSPKHIDAAAKEIGEAEYLLMQLEIPMETVEYAALKANAAGTRVVLNPAPAAPLSDSLLESLYLITPNASEACLLTGVEINSVEDASKAADILLAKGVKNVVVTLGSRGALAKGEGFCEFIPAQKVKAVDTTGAGDTFNGALCVALSEGKSLVEACGFAAKAAALAVSKMGAQPSIPYRENIK